MLIRLKSEEAAAAAARRRKIVEFMAIKLDNFVDASPNQFIHLSGCYVSIDFVHFVGKLLRVSRIVFQADVVNFQTKAPRCVDALDANTKPNRCYVV